ncbi:MAG TPA: C/D box methylation guide ribonucleoprotein complex aNOP56 subunit [Candidatus Bathyarchaeia archaeon]|nr:C/D box methylation guide ribonucleoprotein complex aNOP56 subunit [Candidatus Bathyarchaeia archaeon]
MKAYLVDSPAGLFLLEKTGKIAEKALFPSNPKDAAVKLEQVRKGELPDDLGEFSTRLSQLELEKLTVDNGYLAKLARSILSSAVVLDERDETISRLRNRLPNILVRLRIVESKDDYEKLVHDVSMELARTSIMESGAKRDLYAIQTVRCIEDLDKVLNLLAGRIREWYGLHFPELDRLVEKHDSYIRMVQSLGTRDSFSQDALLKLGIPQERSRIISEAALKSSGADLSRPDLLWLQEVCGTVLQMYKLRDTAEKYTDKIMMEVAPNMTGVLGAVLSAKILSMAGGLENVAKMPASTIQVLGAEKALFRTLKTGARPPKHGIIFQFAPIHQAPKWMRGRASRAVAGKLAIASRMDAYGGSNEGDRMRTALEKKLVDLKDRYQGQPPRKKYGTQWRPASRKVRGGIFDREEGGREIRNTQPSSRNERLRRGHRQSWR